MSLQFSSESSDLNSGTIQNDLLAGRILLCLSVVSWILLMFPMLTAGPLVLDEHGSYWIIDSDLPGTSLERSLNYAAIPPFSSWLQSLFLSVLGKSEFAFRLPSALCALGAIIISYFTGKEIRNCLTGGIMAMIVAWHPEAMDEVRIARCYGLVLLLGAVVFWSTIRWCKKPASITRCLIWTASSVALLWTHYTSALLVIISGLGLAGVFFVTKQLNRKTFGLLILAVALLLIFCWELVPSVLRLKQWGPALNYSGGSASLHDIFGPFWWAGLPAGVVLIFLLGGHKIEYKIRKDIFVLTAVSVLVPLLLLWLLSRGETSSLANPRYRVAYAPAASGLIAILLTSRSRLLMIVFTTAVFLVVSWYFSALSPFQLGRLNHPTAYHWKELNDYIDANSHEEELLFVQSGLTEGYLVPFYHEDRQFMEYVACRVSRFYVDEVHQRYALPFIWDETSGMIDFYTALINEAKLEGQSFWVACATDTDLNRNSLAGIQKIAAINGYHPFETKTWNSAILLHYTLNADTE